MPQLSGVPMLQGWADQLGSSLDKLGNGIGAFINPNADVQKELKARIAANPAILQQLIDQEKQNPGSVAKVFGKQIQPLIDGSQGSFNAQREMYLRDAAKNGTSAEAVRADPSVLAMSANKAAGGETQSEFDTNKANATIVGEAAKTAPEKGEFDRAQYKAQFPLISKRAEVEEKTLTADAAKADYTAQNMAKLFAANEKTDHIDAAPLAKKIALGETLTPEEQTNSKTLMDADEPTFRTMISGYEKSHQLEVEAGWHHKGDELASRQLRTEAFRTATSLGMPGSIDAVAAYISDPAAAQRARDVATGKVQPQTEMDRQLGQIETQVGRRENAKSTVLKLKLNNDIAAKVAQIPKTNDPTARAALESSINEDLSNLHVQTGSPAVSFQYNDKSYARDEYGFYINGPDGGAKKINDKDLHKIMFAPKAEQTSFDAVTGGTAGEIDHLEAWRSLDPATREKDLKTLEKTNPGAAAKIRTQLAKPKK